MTSEAWHSRSADEALAHFGSSAAGLSAADASARLAANGPNQQILLNNFLSDVPSMAISTDRVDPERVTHPQRWDITQIRFYMIVFGLVSSVFDLLTFAALLLVFRAGEATFQTTWFVVSLLTESRRRAHPPHAGARVAQPAKCPAAVDDGRGHGVRPRRSVLRARVQGVRFCPAFNRGDGHRRRDRDGLPGGDRGDEALVLPPQGPDARLTIRTAAGADARSQSDDVW